MTKKFKDRRNKFIIIRVTEEEKLRLLEQAQDSKDISKFCRRKLGLK